MLTSHFIKSNIEKVSVEEALQVIQESNALVKTICSPAGDNQSWDEILSKLVKTQQEEKKEDFFTEITATTLLPIDGKINLFEPAHPKYKVMVGMLFDLKKCAIRYIFQNNAYSKNWLNKENGLIPPQITLGELRDVISQARKSEIVLDNNEILAGLASGSLMAVFATKNDLFSRLNALAKQYLIKNVLNKFVPVLIITPQEGILVYEDQQKKRDIEIALSRDKNDLIRALVEREIEIDEKITIEPIISESNIFDEKKPNDPFYKKAEENKLDIQYVPPDVHSIMLSYLEFSEIAKIVHEIPKSEENKIIHSLAKKEFDKIKENDSKLLIKQLSLESINAETVSNLIRKEKDDFPSIERSIIHLWDLDPKGYGFVFSDYVFKTEILNPNIIIAFLRYGSFSNINKKTKEVVYIASENPWESYPPIRIDIEGWSPLIDAILLNNSLIDYLIVSYYPQHIADIMAILNKLEKIVAYYAAYCDYSSAQVANARKSILLQLKQKHDKYYTLTYADKRLIEYHLLSEINQLEDQKSVHEFYRQHANSLYLNQHRYIKYDQMRSRLFPQIKQNVLTALKNKAAKINVNTDTPCVGEEKKILEDKIAILQSMLQAKHTALLKQDRGMIFFLFFSTSRTSLKIKAITEVMGKLKTINHFSELKRFTENLLLDSQLTNRRSFGFRCSDTYLILKKFYNDSFSTESSGAKYAMV